MIKHIKVWKMIVLSLVTFGIYNTVWFARRRDEMVKNYNVTIPHWWWLITPSLISLSIILILFFIQITNPSPAGAIIALTPLMIFPFVMSGIFLWWLWQFGKAAEKITQGKVTLGWVMIYALLLGGCIQYVLQYYFNRLPKKPTAKQYQPSKRFVKYSIIAIVVVYVLSFGAGIAMSAVGGRPPYFKLNTNVKYLESNRLLQEYNSCVDQLNADFPREVTKGAQEVAYDKAYSECEAIRIKQNAAADEYNASISE